MTQQIMARRLLLSAALLSAFTLWPRDCAAQLRAEIPAPASDQTATRFNDQENLSGTYKAHIDFPEKSLKGEAALTIKGNEFTLRTEDGDTFGGRISALTTRGYTAVALKFGGGSVSVRLIRTGRKTVLRNLPGEPKFILEYCPCDSCSDPVRCNCC